MHNKGKSKRCSSHTAKRNAGYNYQGRATMPNQHIVELLVEADKKIIAVSNEIENNMSENNSQVWIDNINDIIRKLDHIVEKLSSHKK